MFGGADRFIHCYALHYFAAAMYSRWDGGGRRRKVADNPQALHVEKDAHPTTTLALAICCNSHERHRSITIPPFTAFYVQM